jgi:hypothetical protein
MNCKEIQTITKHGGALYPTSAAAAEDHIKNCMACKNMLLSERLAPAIIKAASAPDPDSHQVNPNAILVGGIKRRIQEIREQRSSSWETAVESMSGWLAAFAAAAIILVVGAIQLRPSTMTSDLDLITQSVDEHLISDAPGPAGVSKDKPHVDK